MGPWAKNPKVYLAAHLQACGMSEDLWNLPYHWGEKTPTSYFRVPQARVLTKIAIEYRWMVISPWFLGLLGGFKHGFYFPFHIWDVILPIDELHHFSRWLLHHQPDSNHWMIMASVTECSDKPCKSRDGSSHCDDLSGAILTKSLKISEVFSYTILIHIYFIHIYFIYIQYFNIHIP